MNAQGGIDLIRAKQGATDGSLTPNYHADQLQKVFDELRQGFAVIRTSATPVQISSDIDNATILNGLEFQSPSTGFTIANGSEVINNTGETIERMADDFALQVTKAGGAIITLYVYSEQTADGVTWTKNTGSLRTRAISGDGTGMITFPSFATNVPNGTRIRFKMYAVGVGTLSISSPSQVINGDTVTGVAAYWSLKRQS